LDRHLRTRVGRLEVLAGPVERPGQRGRREDGDGTRHPGTGRGGTGCRAGSVVAATAADQARHGQGGQRGQGATDPTRCHELVLPLCATAGADRSTTTVVDLITATATDPTSRASSSTASRLISATTRNGPAWMSTCAITASFTTAVTIPRRRLRADDSSDRPSGSPAWPRTNPARSTPSITRCPCSSRVAASRPPSTQRRTVSALTPSRSAASPIRNTVTERRVPVRIYDVKWPIIFA